MDLEVSLWVKSQQNISIGQKDMQHDMLNVLFGQSIQQISQ